MIQHLKYFLITSLLVTVVHSSNRLNSQDLFPDKNLEAVVRREVFEKRDSKEPLTAKDVENVSQIKGVGKGIKNLKGLEACISLRSIELSENEIVDLGPLKDLKLLQQLILAKNKIKDVTPLQSLVKLQHLDLDQNQIEKIDSLGGFTNMRSFYVAGNKIKDISVVAKFTKVWSMYLQGNPISDLKPLSQLQFLDQLDISNTQVADLSPLAELPRLMRIIMNGSKVSDLKVLVEMAKKDAAGSMRFASFWNLHLKGCPLSDEAKSKQIPELKKLGGRIHL